MNLQITNKKLKLSLYVLVMILFALNLDCLYKFHPVDQDVKRELHLF